jgi:class 3 adenylate cyclase
MVPNDAVTRFRRYRLGAYLGMAVLLVLPGQPAQALGVASMCVLWPSCAILLGNRWGVVPLHLGEAFLTSFVFCAAALPPDCVMAMVAMVLISNAALGGPSFAVSAAVCLTVGTGVGVVFARLVSAFDFWPAPVSLFESSLADGVYIGLVCAYALVIICVAHDRVTMHSGLRRDIDAVNRRFKRYLPGSLIDRVQADPARQCVLERRWLAIVFIDLVSFSRLLETLSAEEAEVVLNDAITIFGDVGRDSVIWKLLGDGVLLGFEADGDRACAVRKAADACQQALSAFASTSDRRRSEGVPVVTQVRCGIASGYCSMGDWGSSDRLDFNVIGACVNRASRLKDCASPMQALMCERSAAVLGSSRQVEPVGVLKLKGLGMEQAWHLVDPPGASAKVPAASARISSGALTDR